MQIPLSRRSFVKRTLVLSAFGISVLQACGRKSAVNTLTNEPISDETHSVYKPFFMPYLDGSGIAMVSLSVEYAGGTVNSMLEFEEGVPFGKNKAVEGRNVEEVRPPSPKIAIWKDGTIIWSRGSTTDELTVFKGSCSAEQRDALLRLLEVRPEESGLIAPTESSVVGSRSDVHSAIAIVADADRYILVSEFLQMEDQQAYWYRNGESWTVMPMGRFRFDEFCANLSEVERALYSRWCLLYETFRQVIPQSGHVVDVDADLSWVVQWGKRYGISL